MQFSAGGCGVISAVDDKKFTIWDGLGTITVNKRENERNGYLLPNYWCIERIEEEEESPFLSVHWFRKQISTLWPVYSQAALATIIINCFTLVIPLFMGIFYDRVLPNLASNSLFVLASGAALVLLFDYVLKNIRCHQVESASLKIERIADPLFLQKLLEKRFCALPQSSGRLTNAVQELSRIKNLFTTQIVLALIDSVFVFFYLFFIFLNSSLLFLVPLVFGSLTVFFAILFGLLLDKNIASQMQLQSRKFSFLNEVFMSLESIKACNGTKNILMLWNTEVYKSSAVSSKYRTTQAKAGYVTALLGQLNTVALIFMAFYLISSGTISSGGLLTTMVLSGRVIAIAASVSNLVISYLFAKRSYEDILKLLEIETEDAPRATYYPEKINGALSLQNVSFRYHPKMPLVLQNISLKIKPGERIGIIGPTGCGKSTLMKLLTGLAAPTEGVINCDDYNMANLSLSRVRDFMGIIPQSPMLLQGTLESNLLLGDSMVSRQSLEQALRAAGLLEMIKAHPMGIKMQIAEGGNNLSRGQRQAICLARALVHNPPMLFFDEPTSSMDSAREQVFVDNLKKILRNQVFVVITHRKKLLSLVDRLIVIEKGRITYDGAPKAFLEAGHANV